jgi:hypothetical protein
MTPEEKSEIFWLFVILILVTLFSAI